MSAILTRPSVNRMPQPLSSLPPARELLSFAQEQTLARQAIEGRSPREREQARQRLILANQRLVHKIAGQFHNAPISQEDLAQEGMCGLIHAIDNFDYRLGLRISTFAVIWIRQAIMRALTNQGRLIRMPAHVYDSLRLLQQTRQKLGNQLGRTPSLMELAQELDMPESKVTQLLAASLLPLSFDAPVGEAQDTRLGDMIEAPDTCDPLQLATRQSVGQSVREAMQILSPQEQEILIARYGLNGDDPCSLEELSKKRKSSRERLRQIEMKALHKLRRNKDMRLLDFQNEG